jgi:hypothetical protein
MTDLEQYLSEIVDPTLKDFEANPASRRHAFLACVVTCHAVDYLAHPNAPQTLSKQISKESRAFEIVNDVGQAFKHVVRGERSNPRMRQSEVIERPPGVWGEMVWDLSRWDDPIGGVTLDSDRNIDLLETVREAVNLLWEKVRAAAEPSSQ